MRMILLMTTLFCFQVFCFGQTNENKMPLQKNARLNQSKPSVYLTFEKFATTKPLFQGESEKRVFLRFSNNSIWKVYIRTFGVTKDYGDFGVPYQVEVMPPKWEKKIKDEDIPLGYKLTSSVKTIESGQSFLFSIPKEHLAEELFISVSFSYEWEEGGYGGGGGLEIVHQASFFSAQLPKD